MELAGCSRFMPELQLPIGVKKAGCGFWGKSPRIRYDLAQHPDSISLGVRDDFARHSGMISLR
jgi:hypothetical protein